MSLDPTSWNFQEALGTYLATHISEMSLVGHRFSAENGGKFKFHRWCHYNVTLRTSPRPVARSRPNFHGRSVPCQLMFISRTGLVGQGSAEKRAGNSNFIGGPTIEAAVCVRVLAHWWPGVARCDQMLPGGDQGLPGGDQALPGVTRYGSENGKKSVFSFGERQT